MPYYFFEIVIPPAMRATLIVAVLYNEFQMPGTETLRSVCTLWSRFFDN